MACIDWTFPYTGQELIEPTAARKQAFRTAALEGLTELANLEQSAAHNEFRIESLREEVDENENTAFMLAIYEAMFRREPERTFELELADVEYFGLVEFCLSVGE